MVHGTVITIDHTKLFNNHGLYCVLVISNTTIVTVTHSEFLDNNIIAGLDFTDGSLIYLDVDVITVQLSKFINNIIASSALVDIPYYDTSESITNKCVS